MLRTAYDDRSLIRCVLSFLKKVAKERSGPGAPWCVKKTLPRRFRHSAPCAFATLAVSTTATKQTLPPLNLPSDARGCALRLDSGVSNFVELEASGDLQFAGAKPFTIEARWPALGARTRAGAEQWALRLGCWARERKLERESQREEADMTSTH